jgi:hypothetical protein
MTDQKKLRANCTRPETPDRRRAARAGSRLLQGLLLCGRCGYRSTRYSGSPSRAPYMCRPNVGNGVCWSMSAPAIDHAVSQPFLDVIQPPEIEPSPAVLRTAEDQAEDVDPAVEAPSGAGVLRRAAGRALYKAIDPDHRVVARTLEREWMTSSSPWSGSRASIMR